MGPIEKGISPFDPGKPVHPELFIGRREEIARIDRAASEVTNGKSRVLFIRGDYGIGKSSLAKLTHAKYSNPDEEKRLFGIHVMLGGSKTLDDVSAKVIEETTRSIYSERSEIKQAVDFLAKYITKAELFGVSLDVEKIRDDAPAVKDGFLSFLRSVYNRVKASGYKGILLILDEINGIAANPDFAYFLKSLHDQNAVSDTPINLMVMLCGTKEKYGQITGNYEAVARIFDVIEVYRLGDSETKDFFVKAFGSAGKQVDDVAITLMVGWSNGFPVLMHMIGDEVFYADRDGRIDDDDTERGVAAAISAFGRRYLDEQVIKVIQSEDYWSILHKLLTNNVKNVIDRSFSKADISDGLTLDENKKLDNFLQRMKKLGVIASSGRKGDYVFTNSMVLAYLSIRSVTLKTSRGKGKP